MRITRGKLQDLINEEISRCLLQSENRRLTEVWSRGDELQDIDIADILDFAKKYVELGTAVQEQLDDLVDNPEDAACNPNAVGMIKERLGGFNADLDEAIDLWEQENGDVSSDVDESADPLHVEDKSVSDKELSKYRCKKCRQGTADVRMDGEPGYECNVCGQPMPEVGDYS